DWEIKLERSEFAEYSDSNGAGARNTGRFCGGAGENHAGRRLFAGGIADHGAFFEGCSAGGCVSKRAGHSRAHGTGSVWRGADGGDQFDSGAITEFRGTNGIEFSIAGNRSRFDQDGDDWDRETVERRKAESTDDPASA